MRRSAEEHEQRSGSPMSLRHRHAGWVSALVLALVVSGTPNSSRAETVQGTYHQALKDYYAGRYQQAVEQLERLVALPLQHEELFYNLGNAYFRWGKLGYAIYNYERALRLDPNFDDARFNLGLARAEASNHVKDVLKGQAEEPFWTAAVNMFSLSGWWTIVIVLWWLVLGLIYLLRRIGHGPLRAGLVALNGILLLGLLSASLLLVGRIRLAGAAPEGIILVDRSAVREGPDPAARETLKFHAGLKVLIKGESGAWARVRLPNGLEGWVPRREVGIL